MSQDDAMRARVKGRMRKAGLTVWQLSIGPVQFRCVRDGDDFLVEMKHEKGWEPTAWRSCYPGHLLRNLASSQGVSKVVDEVAEAVKGAG